MDKFYVSIEVMQKDLDTYLNHCSVERVFQGHGRKGRTTVEAYARCLTKPEFLMEQEESA